MLTERALRLMQDPRVMKALQTVGGPSAVTYLGWPSTIPSPLR